ncbi:TPA: hypothetical protein MJD78_08760 [Klebsiella pneumoniae]|nr:hypothetical protein [Klebsiella pneumoniae]
MRMNTINDFGMSELGHLDVQTSMMADFGHLYVNENHYNLMGPPGGGGCHGAACSRKTASFHIS